MMSPGHEEGFAFLTNCTIDQHVVARSRQFDLFPVIQRHPRLLGLGIDEAMALVVQGDIGRVVGESTIHVYNLNEPGDDPELPFRTLREGDRLDLKNRRVLDGETE